MISAAASINTKYFPNLLYRESVIENGSHNPVSRSAKWFELPVHGICLEGPAMPTP